MSRVSRKTIERNVLAQIEDNFTYLISSLSTPRDIQHFLETFLTSEEKTMLSKRLMLHLMLKNKYNFDEIYSILGMSKDTIYKHKLIWQTGDEIYRSIITKLANKEKIKTFWEKIEKALRPVENMLSAKTNMKARAKLMSTE